MAEASGRGPLAERNRLIRENRVEEYTSPNRALGMEPVEFGPGSSRWEWKTQPAAALNPFGTIQGGYLAVLVDELMSSAIGSVLEEGEWAMTAEFKINFLRALLPAALSGTARVLKRSRTIAFLEAQVETADHRVAVTASATWAVMKG